MTIKEMYKLRVGDKLRVTIKGELGTPFQHGAVHTVLFITHSAGNRPCAVVAVDPKKYPADKLLLKQRTLKSHVCLYPEECERV